uniref:Uncharacterized protein n=1 Tax=Lactuca sativa TaxID=4236 RepID=A0A9R1VPL0_LACSA|nr:hypothetical protein LSAT_V11C500252400 [Lactuca sativa]
MRTMNYSRQSSGTLHKQISLFWPLKWGSHKDLVMLVASCLRDEYNGVKSTITCRKCPTAFTKLHALLIDYEFMIANSRQPSIQAFDATQELTKHTNDLMTSFTAQLGPIASALGLQLKLILPLSTLPTTSQALYCSRQPPPTTVETTEGDVALTVATTTIVVTTIVVIVLAPSVGIPTRILFFGTCNHYGIGHLPSQCPNHDLSTIRNRPISNFVDSSASIPSTSATWYPDTGANSHVTPDLTIG